MVRMREGGEEEVAYCSVLSQLGCDVIEEQVTMGTDANHHSTSGVNMSLIQQLVEEEK